MLSETVMVEYKRAKKTRRWKIPDKFINEDFANFILNTNDQNLNERPIEN